jgi:Tfp pilus assembly protein PilF
MNTMERLSLEPTMETVRSALHEITAVAPRASLFALALWIAGCGGGTQASGPGAAAPGAAGATPGVTPPAGAPVVNEGGQQVAVADAPTSGEQATNRPEMSSSAAEAYSAGMQAFQAGDLQGAKAQFTKAVDADPRAYKAQYSLGVVRERLHETQGALNAYRKAVDVVPDYEPALVAYGVLQANAGQPADAEQFLSSALAKFPRSAAVTAGLAEVKSIQSDSGAAQRLAREALKKNPDYRPAMVTIARDHYRNRRLDLALYTLKGILDGYGEENPPRDKNSADARLLRALIYKEQGLRKPATEEFQKALELRPDLVEPRVHLAAYLLESGNATEAAPMLEAALRFDSTHVLARLNLGDAYRLLARPADAKRELEWVIARDPSLAQPHYDLGLLYLFTDNIPGVTPKQATDLAVTSFEKYKELRSRTSGTPDDTEELITRAKSKKAIIEAKEAEAAAATAQPAPAGGAQ